MTGTWLDGTFGAGGYTRGLLDAGAERVIAVDRDPLAFEMAQDWAGAYGDRIVMQPGVFSNMDEYASGSGRRRARSWRVVDAAGSGRTWLFLHERRAA